MTNLIDSYHTFRLRTKRDPEAFAQIYDRHVEAIYRFAALKLPTAEEAQDVTSETFTRTWQYIVEKKQILNIRAMLYKVARNLIADHYRRQHPVESFDRTVTFDPLSASTLVQAEKGDKGEGHRLIEARADFALILKQMELLKEDYRDVLLLRLVDDLPFDMIGEILEKSTGTVRVIYHRALKALKELEGMKDAADIPNDH